MNSHLSNAKAPLEWQPMTPSLGGVANTNRPPELVCGDMHVERRSKTRGTTLHIIDGNSTSRARLSRLALMGGLHAEIYTDCDELVQCTPTAGVILCVCESASPILEDLLGKLKEQGVWLPVIVYSQVSDARSVVEAIKLGAFDYLVGTLDVNVLNQSIDRVLTEMQGVHALRTQEAAAAAMISRLSPREKQVLLFLSQGNSNKAIARDLEISPRTVEIHRTKLMGKLGARHAAEAVRFQLLAQGRNALAV